MSKTGQARVLSPDQFAHLLSAIQEHRYPEKNTALVQISFKLGLRVQEIALLQLKDVAELGPDTTGQRSFKLKEILALPAAYTKGADALNRSKSTYQRRRIGFSVHDFDQLVRRAYSRPRLPLIPDEACHPFHAKAATDSTAKLPPWQAA